MSISITTELDSIRFLDFFVIVKPLNLKKWEKNQEISILIPYFLSQKINQIITIEKFIALVLILKKILVVSIIYLVLNDIGDGI